MVVVNAVATRSGSAQLSSAPAHPNWDEQSGARPWPSSSDLGVQLLETTSSRLYQPVSLFDVPLIRFSVRIASDPTGPPIQLRSSEDCKECSAEGSDAGGISLTSSLFCKTWAPGSEGTGAGFTQVVDCRVDLALVTAIVALQFHRETQHDAILNGLVLFDRMTHCNRAVKDCHALGVPVKDSFDILRYP